MQNAQQLLTLNHAARQLGIAPNTLRTHANRGRIECVRASDRSRLFPAPAIEAEIERRRNLAQTRSR